MSKPKLQVGDVVYAKPTTIGKYIVTGYSRGFIGIVVRTGRMGVEEDIVVLDLFASTNVPLVYNLASLFQETNPDAASNLEFFRHALLNRPGPYTKPVSPFLTNLPHAFVVNSNYFNKMEDPSLLKWKEHVINCISISKVKYEESYQRNRLDPADLDGRLDTLVKVLSQYVLTIKPISQPKLSL